MLNKLSTLIKSIDENKYYIPFVLFWIIVILPKPIQLVVLVVLLVFLIGMHFESPKDKFFDIQCVVLIIYLISILFNALTGNHEATRIYAALNTLAISFCALLFYSLYSKTQLDIKKIGKFALFNMAILLLLLCIYLFYTNYNEINIMGHFIGVEDRAEGLSTRFVGLFAYSNLIPLFSIVMLPFALAYLETKKKIYSFILLVVNFFFSYFANSRSGILIILFIAIFYLYKLLELGKKFKNMKIPYKILIICLFILVIFLFSPIIYSKIQNLFLMRGESNSMRLVLYSTSLEKMWNENPFIGVGIKDLLEGTIYPYGSHSSYLGYFYKTGIIGGAIYISSFVYFFVQEIKWKKSNLSDYAFFFCSIGLFIWMLLEDLDGENWAICFGCIMLGVINNRIQQAKINSNSKCNKDELNKAMEYNL